jgi:chromosome segregation ATPase
VNQDRDKLRNSDHNMRQQMAESQAELETLKRRSSEIEADLSRRNQNTRDELSQCQNRLQQINDQLNDALQSERRLKTMSSEAHAIAEHLQAARTQSEKEFSERLQAVEDELQRANAKVLHYKSREQELSTKENLLNRRIRDMEDELRVLQNTLRDTQASLHKANSKSTELADKLQRQELDRSKFEEEIATDKERLNREKQKLSSRLSAAEDAIQQYEKQLSDTKMELRKSTDYARELESKTHELEHNLSTCRQQTQALSDDFSQHSKARDWQLEALKTRLQVSDEKCKKACEREDELLKQLEAKHNEMARLECTSVQKELQSRQQIDAQQLKIKSLEDIVSHTKQDNEALHKLLEMPAEEFAFQAIERSGPMARTFRKSELPARRTSTSGLSIAHKPLFTPRDMPSQVPSSFASVQIKDETPVSCQGDELPQRDADLQKELSDLRTKMKSMDLSSDSSPKSNRYTTTHLPISQASQWPSHDVPIEADKKEKRDSTTHETRQPTKLTVRCLHPMFSSYTSLQFSCGNIYSLLISAICSSIRRT